MDETDIQDLGRLAGSGRDGRGAVGGALKAEGIESRGRFGGKEGVGRGGAGLEAKGDVSDSDFKECSDFVRKGGIKCCGLVGDGGVTMGIGGGRTSTVLE